MGTSIKDYLSQFGVEEYCLDDYLHNSAQTQDDRTNEEEFMDNVWSGQDGNQEQHHNIPKQVVAALGEGEVVGKMQRHRSNSARSTTATKFRFPILDRSISRGGKKDARDDVIHAHDDVIHAYTSDGHVTSLTQCGVEDVSERIVVQQLKAKLSRSSSQYADSSHGTNKTQKTNIHTKTSKQKEIGSESVGHQKLSKNNNSHWNSRSKTWTRESAKNTLTVKKPSISTKEPSGRLKKSNSTDAVPGNTSLSLKGVENHGNTKGVAKCDEAGVSKSDSPPLQPDIILENVLSTCDNDDPLLKAAQHDDFDAMKKLLTEYGNNVYKTRNSIGDTCLHIAVQHGHTGTVQLLCEHFPALTGIENKAKLNPAAMAIKCGKSSIVEWLLYGHSSLSEQLIREPARLTHYAAKYGQESCLRVLLESLRKQCKELPDLSDSNLNTPAHSAAKHGHLACLQTLVEYGIDVTRPNIHGYSPCYYADFGSHRECAGYLCVIETALHVITELLENKPGLGKPDLTASSSSLWKRSQNSLKEAMLTTNKASHKAWLLLGARLVAACQELVVFRTEAGRGMMESSKDATMERPYAQNSYFSTAPSSRDHQTSSFTNIQSAATDIASSDGALPSDWAQVSNSKDTLDALLWNNTNAENPSIYTAGYTDTRTTDKDNQFSSHEYENLPAKTEPNMEDTEVRTCLNLLQENCPQKDQQTVQFLSQVENRQQDPVPVSEGSHGFFPYASERDSLHESLYQEDRLKQSGINTEMEGLGKDNTLLGGREHIQCENNQSDSTGCREKHSMKTFQSRCPETPISEDPVLMAECQAGNTHAPINHIQTPMDMAETSFIGESEEEEDVVPRPSGRAVSLFQCDQNTDLLHYESGAQNTSNQRDSYVFKYDQTELPHIPHPQFSKSNECQAEFAHQDLAFESRQCDPPSSQSYTVEAPAAKYHTSDSSSQQYNQTEHTKLEAYACSKSDSSQLHDTSTESELSKLQLAETDLLTPQATTSELYTQQYDRMDQQHLLTNSEQSTLQYNRIDHQHHPSKFEQSDQQYNRIDHQHYPTESEQSTQQYNRIDHHQHHSTKSEQSSQQYNMIDHQHHPSKPEQSTQQYNMIDHQHHPSKPEQSAQQYNRIDHPSKPEQSTQQYNRIDHQHHPSKSEQSTQQYNWKDHQHQPTESEQSTQQYNRIDHQHHPSKSEQSTQQYNRIDHQHHSTESEQSTQQYNRMDHQHHPNKPEQATQQYNRIDHQHHPSKSEQSTQQYNREDPQHHATKSEQEPFSFQKLEPSSFHYNQASLPYTEPAVHPNNPSSSKPRSTETVIDKPHFEDEDPSSSSDESLHSKWLGTILAVHGPVTGNAYNEPSSNPYAQSQPNQDFHNPAEYAFDELLKSRKNDNPSKAASSLLPIKVTNLEADLHVPVLQARMTATSQKKNISPTILEHTQTLLEHLAKYNTESNAHDSSGSLSFSSFGLGPLRCSSTATSPQADEQQHIDVIRKLTKEIYSRSPSSSIDSADHVEATEMNAQILRHILDLQVANGAQPEQNRVIKTPELIKMSDAEFKECYDRPSSRNKKPRKPPRGSSEQRHTTTRSYSVDL